MLVTCRWCRPSGLSILSRSTRVVERFLVNWRFNLLHLYLQATGTETTLVLLLLSARHLVTFPAVGHLCTLWLIQNFTACWQRCICVCVWTTWPAGNWTHWWTLFYSKLQCSDNIVLQTSVCVPTVKYEILLLGLAAKYGLSDMKDRLSTIRDTVWSHFVQSWVLVFF